jgi:hypothetical protein
MGVTETTVERPALRETTNTTAARLRKVIETMGWRGITV